MTATGLSYWEGTWKEGKGTISIQTNILKDAPYTFASRFEGAAGASPEELLAAAHAACYNQALSNVLGQHGFIPESINTSVAIELGYGEDNHPEIKGSHISVSAKVPNVAEDVFQSSAERSRVSCTISKIFNCEITLNAILVK